MCLCGARGCDFGPAGLSWVGAGRRLDYFACLVCAAYSRHMSVCGCGGRGFGCGRCSELVALASEYDVRKDAVYFMIIKESRVFHEGSVLQFSVG